MLSKFLFRRLVQSIVVLIGAVLLSFILLRIVPGDAALMMLPETATEAEIEAMRDQLGLNEPLSVQFSIYINQILRGDFGKSLRRDLPALRLIFMFLPATVKLAAAAMVITLAFAIPAGIFSAFGRNSWLDNLVAGFAVIGQSVPTYWLGIVLMLIFSVRLRVLPTSGFGTWKHLVLPAVTLGSAHMALVVRLMRSSMIDVLQEDYIRTAKAKGLTARSVIFKHALKNALIPTVTVIGLQFGTLLSGAIITEAVFGWPGVGSLIVQSIAFRDYPVVQAAVLVSALFFVVINLLLDILYMILDPRIAYK